MENWTGSSFLLVLPPGNLAHWKVVNGLRGHHFEMSTKNVQSIGFHMLHAIWVDNMFTKGTVAISNCFNPLTL